MGINIGDLSKVLLRNAPPSSASYVQRVGRAGRGREKNSIAVTLCRRTKYDGDAWNDPPRLMSGIVRTPTVFTDNKVIAQRHINALAFSFFLRMKIADEKVIENISQRIRLSVFLPLEARSRIPDSWIGRHSKDLFLDFIRWLEPLEMNDLFKTDSGRTLQSSENQFADCKRSIIEKYRLVIDDLSQELTDLMTEREKLHKEGIPTNDIEQAIKNLLNDDVIELFARRGFLPRYAFPLDVVTLETGKTRWSRDSEVELSRDRGIAIAEFAPGAQVIARKKVYTSAGLYIVGRNDEPERQWFSRCPDCEQIRTSRTTQESLYGECEICKRQITTQYVNAFIEPKAFSIRLDTGRSADSARHRRSTLVRQRQTIAHFIDTVEDSRFVEQGLFRLSLKENGKLFRYNLVLEIKVLWFAGSAGAVNHWMARNRIRTIKD